MDSDSYLACHVNDGRTMRLSVSTGAKEVRHVMSLIKSRRRMDLEQLHDEAIDFRSVRTSPLT